MQNAEMEIDVFAQSYALVVVHAVIGLDWILLLLFCCWCLWFDDLKSKYNN